MEGHKESFRATLKKRNVLSMKYVNELLKTMREHMNVEPLPRRLLSNRQLGPRITDSLGSLPLYVARGARSWEGLAVAFPGTTEQLSTESVGTPYLREILYPILELHRRAQRQLGGRAPCLYLLGVRFSDVFLRKFRLLASVVPHVIVLTHDLQAAASRRRLQTMPSPKRGISEASIQRELCKMMRKPEGLSIPVSNDSIKTGFVSYEFPTYEGTKNPERLDILGFDRTEHSLVAFEIKGPECGRVQLENLFLQGMEHRNWLEDNKMAVKFMCEGPGGRSINTRKRVRLVLGLCADDVPPLFSELRAQAIRKDPHLKVDFVKLVLPRGTAHGLRLEIPRMARELNPEDLDG